MNQSMAGSFRLETRGGVTARPMTILDNLGRPTRRGIRKCPGCGTLNGTRGLSCKNKLCSHVFREKLAVKSGGVTAKRKTMMTSLSPAALPSSSNAIKLVIGHVGRPPAMPKAVKIVNGALVHLFSVRSPQRGSTDTFGFVQLPFVQDCEGNTSDVVDPVVYAFIGQCHIPDCPRDSPRLRPTSSHTVTLPTSSPNSTTPDCCPHVFAAIRCMGEVNIETAVPLFVSMAIVDALPIPDDVRELLGGWIAEEGGDGVVQPVVQRIPCTSTMVVRCVPDAKNEFGFVHLVVGAAGRSGGEPVKQRGASRNMYHCYCSNVTKVDSPSSRCVHFYACICAFIGDEQLAAEFKPFIQLVTKTADREIEFRFGTESDLTTEGTESMDEGGDCVVGDDTQELLDLDCTSEPSGVVNPAPSCHESLIMQSGLTAAVFDPAGGDHSLIMTSSPTKVAVDDLIVGVRKHGGGGGDKKLLDGGSSLGAISLQPVLPDSIVDEASVYISFIEWLSGVTERINLSMHYQFNGKPDPLVFYVAQKLFDCFQLRLAGGARKRRLPNLISRYERKDVMPVGTFTKSTWHITNVLYLKQIFDTPKVKLEVTRNFVQKNDGRFEYLQEQPGNTLYPSLVDQSNKRPIRPSQLKTYLKVGNTSPDQTTPTPFIIEWIANVLPQSGTGELRVTYEYGHLRNGQRVERQQSTPIVMSTSLGAPSLLTVV